jgi:RNA polymerase sigma-70 factor, ECF subfamily
MLNSWKPLESSNISQNSTTSKDFSSSDSRRAFMRIYSTIEPDLLKLGRRLALGNEERAQDLLQETVVRAYAASRDRPIEPETAKSWMMRIMTNLFINEYRRRKKWEADIDVDTLTSFGDSGPEQTHAALGDTPGIALLARTLDEELEAALAQLTDALRLTITLVDMQGLEYAEAASVMGVPIGTVRSRLARARMQLHDLLQDFARRRGYAKKA